MCHRLNSFVLDLEQGEPAGLMRVIVQPEKTDLLIRFSRCNAQRRSEIGAGKDPGDAKFSHGDNGLHSKLKAASKGGGHNLASGD
jgi:hypothetical protein